MITYLLTPVSYTHLDVYKRQGVNIANMTNKSKGDYAYTMLDVTSPIDSQVAEALRNIEHVYRVRVVK